MQYFTTNYGISEEAYYDNEILLLGILHRGKKEFKNLENHMSEKTKKIMDVFGSMPSQTNLKLLFDNEIMVHLWFSEGKLNEPFVKTKELKALVDQMTDTEAKGVQKFLRKVTELPILPFDI